MRTKAIKLIALIIQFLLAIIVVVTCIMAIYKSKTETGIMLAAPYGIQALIVLSFSFVYFFVFKSNNSPESLFIPLEMLAVTLSELKVFEVFTQLTGKLIISQEITSAVFLSSLLFSFFLFIGFALFHQSHQIISAVAFLSISFIFSILALFFFPMAQTISALLSDFLSSKPTDFFHLISILASVAVIEYLVLAITEQSGIFLIRHIASIFCVVGHFLMMCFNSQLIPIIGIALFTLGGIAIIIISSKSSIQF